ncbi:hypothetical protein F9C07_10130 [Aspergillus flavus]|uniref:Uncharacterized protein n=1 Tax=Aspergillus flavus (strain ATCC 200026 / FGSC A1120 / IAM 13836 / NRRL 3357 / JCM 12722 / SRRC 167) TaxID=332952 RepID=A0A7U2MWD5_ASPFN|nr:hypothetical protein F9C07_10130 [Aspergillus flavus]
MNRRLLDVEVDENYRIRVVKRENCGTNHNHLVDPWLKEYYGVHIHSLYKALQ